LLLLVVLVVGFAGGVLVGMQVQRRASRTRTPQVSRPEAPATLQVLDTVVADSIKRLTRWINPPRDEAAEPPLTLAPDGTITLLFSDIARSTSLNRRLGDDDFAALLAAHDQVVREVVAGHGGRVIKTQGDGFMAAFHDPAAAVLSALDLREQLADEDRTGHELDVRIGLHTGPAVTAAGDVFGESVAYAARVADTARGGEVLVSESLRRRVEADTDRVHFVARLLPSRMKGVPGLHQLHRADRA
jgi:adenylate cyclase